MGISEQFQNQFLQFKPFTRGDLSLMHHWFQEPTIKRQYARDLEWSLEAIKEKYLPRIKGEDPVPSYIIDLNQKPIGFIQYYCLTDHLPEGVGGINHPLFKQAKPEQLVGIDLFIADETLRGKGLGLQVINQFISEKLNNYRAVIVDPLLSNTHAIRCYQKAGFISMKDSENPEYLLMIKRLSY